MGKVRWKVLFLIFFSASADAFGRGELVAGGSLQPEPGPWSSLLGFLRPDPESISFVDAYRAAQSKHEAIVGGVSQSSESEDYNPAQSKIIETTSSSGYRAAFFTKGLDRWDVIRIGAGISSIEGKVRTKGGQLSVFETEPASYATFDTREQSRTMAFTTAVALPFGLAAAAGMESVSQSAVISAEGEADEELNAHYNRVRASFAWAWDGHQTAVAWQPAVIIKDESGPVMKERKISLFYHYLLNEANLGLGVTHHGWRALGEEYTDKFSYTVTSEQRATSRMIVALEGTYAPGFYRTYGALDPVTMSRSGIGLRMDFGLSDQVQLILKGAMVAKYRKEIEQQGFVFSSLYGEREFSASLRGLF